MGELIGYTRVSTRDQHTAGHKDSIEKSYRISKWFEDESTSGTTEALKRPGFAALHQYVREGDTVIVPAIDRLGRDTIDVLTTVEAVKAKGATIISQREGFDLSTAMGKMMLTMLAAVAELERDNIRERQRVGLERAKAEGKVLGRPAKADKAAVSRWRHENGSSISQTAAHFEISESLVKQACREHKAEEA